MSEIMKKLKPCLSAADLNDYLSGALSAEKKAEVEKHLDDCSACLEKMVFAYETVKEFNGSGKKEVRNMKTTAKRNLWLLGAIIAFALSFFVQRYFAQFLIATVLLGAKWIFESANARILIMIYDAWKKGGEEEASKILGSFGDRINRQ